MTKLADLTREQILNYPAGRELDCLLTEHALGLEPVEPGSVLFRPSPAVLAKFRAKNPGVEGVNFISAPYLSMQIEVAMALAAKFRMSVHAPGRPGPFVHEDQWSAFAYSPPNADGFTGGGEWGYGETAPLAICRAALLAVWFVERAKP